MFRYCSNCKEIVLGFKKNGYNEFRRLRDLVKAEQFEFLAGSCPLEDIEFHLNQQDLFTIEHYFRCKCGLIYYTGFCARGMPIVKIIKKLPKNIDKTISGNYGTYFNK